MPFILPLHESSGAEGVDFHGANRSPSEQFPTKYAASTACEKCQLIHFNPFMAVPAKRDSDSNQGVHQTECW